MGEQGEATIPSATYTYETSCIEHEVYDLFCYTNSDQFHSSITSTVDRVSSILHTFLLPSVQRERS